MKLFRRQRFESDMDAEFRFHVDAYVADLVRSGVDRREAERRARMEFGSMEARKDECRQAWGLQPLDELRTDLRLAVRALRQSPGFAAVAIVSLALGIGANTAIFSVFDAVMLRLLPVTDPRQLAFIHMTGATGRDGPPYPFFEFLRDQARSFAAVSAFSPASVELMVDRGREQARALWVSGNFYEMLGVRPLIGRTLTAADDQMPGKVRPDGAVAVISRAYWQQRFGGDPAVIGGTIYLDRTAVTIVGIMPTEIMSLEPNLKTDGTSAIGILGSPQRAVIRWEGDKMVIRWNMDRPASAAGGASGRQGANPSIHMDLDVITRRESAGQRNAPLW